MRMLCMMRLRMWRSPPRAKARTPPPTHLSGLLGAAFRWLGSWRKGSGAVDGTRAGASLAAASGLMLLSLGAQ